jgi:hypothetical protein
MPSAVGSGHAPLSPAMTNRTGSVAELDPIRSTISRFRCGTRPTYPRAAQANDGR